MGCKHSVSNIERNLTESASECGTDKLLTTRLFFAISILEVHSVDGALNALCISQGSSLIASIQTRLHLVDLVELYKQKRMQYQRDCNQAFTDSETIARITSERFPLLGQDAPEFKRQYKNLRRKLYDGRNWHMLALGFGISIVYFLPSKGEFEISNTTHVNPPGSCYKKLTSLLESNKYQNTTLTTFWKFCLKNVAASFGNV
ncbi:hypothetical protein BDW75DRAFT_235570 [Aspergillus navahoensis]